MRSARRFVIPAVAILFAFVLPGSCLADAPPEPVTAILGAFGAELELLRGAITNRADRTFLGVSFVVGELEGRAVVLGETGVGKVNAAMTTTLLIDHFRPKEVIFTGIAGGLNPDLLPGDIVIGARTAQHDLGTVTAEGFQNWGVRNPLTGERNPVYFPSDDRLRGLAREAGSEVDLEGLTTTRGERTPRIAEGTILTGDAFVASSSERSGLRTRMEGDAVEMEGAAVAQVCYQHSVPCIVIRSLSDSADEDASEDLERFYRVSAGNSARLVRKIIQLLAREQALQGERS